MVIEGLNLTQMYTRTHQIAPFKKKYRRGILNEFDIT